MTDPAELTGLILDQLLKNIKTGECVIFLGVDLPLLRPTDY